LLAGDLLYIPDQLTKTPASFSLTVGSTNAFVASTPPTVTLTIEFVDSEDSAYASRAYTIQELDALTGLQTNGQGVATFDAPVTLDRATMVFTDTGETWVLAIGHLDPVGTLSGAYQRLQGLGHIDPATDFDAMDPSSNFDTLRLGLGSLKAASSDGDGAPDSGAPSDGDDSAPDSAPPSSGDSTPDSGAPSGDDSTPDSAPPSSDGSPDSSPPSSGSDDSSDSQDAADDPAADDAGLDDKGNIDQDTTGLLFDAFGC
jgi:hypothetical protein